MKAYSVDLRRRIVDAVAAGRSKSDVAQLFSVSVPTINRYLRLDREDGSLEPRSSPGRPSVKGTALLEGLEPQLKVHSDATIPEHCALWTQGGGVAVSEATMSRALKRLGWPLKKSR